jgi:hypothetical protein
MEQRLEPLKGAATSAGFPEGKHSGRPFESPPRASWAQSFRALGPKPPYLRESCLRRDALAFAGLSADSGGAPLSSICLARNFAHSAASMRVGSSCTSLSNPRTASSRTAFVSSGPAMFAKRSQSACGRASAARRIPTSKKRRLRLDQPFLDQLAAPFGKEHLLPVVLQLKREIALPPVFRVKRVRFLFRKLAVGLGRGRPRLKARNSRDRLLHARTLGAQRLKRYMILVKNPPFSGPRSGALRL